MPFSRIIGQDMAVRTLRRSIERSAVAHAYLFAGPEGVGKYATALEFAAALNCENPPQPGDSCGECVQCRMIAKSQHADILSISPTGGSEETRIGQMQEMRRMAQFAPLRGRWKLDILERAETLNDEAASCILKLVEEPPAYLVLILITSNPAAMLPTIRSRCQLVRFRAMPADALESVLVERFGAQPERARFLASFSEGRPGRAISLLAESDFFARRDAIISLAGRAIDEGVESALKLSEDLRKLAAGTASTEDGEEEDDGAGGRISATRSDLARALDVLVAWYRDLVSMKVRGPNAAVVNVDKRAELTRRAADCRLTYLRESLRSLTEARRHLDGYANTQLVSDVLAMRLMS